MSQHDSKIERQKPIYQKNAMSSAANRDIDFFTGLGGGTEVLQGLSQDPSVTAGQSKTAQALTEETHKLHCHAA